jgi:hypothetical protein
MTFVQFPSRIRLACGGDITSGVLSFFCIGIAGYLENLRHQWIRALEYGGIKALSFVELVVSITRS